MKRLAVLCAVSGLALAGACGSDDPVVDGRVAPTAAPTPEQTGARPTSTETDAAAIRDRMQANPNVPEPIVDFTCPDTFVKAEGNVMDCEATLESGLIVDIEVTYVNNLGAYEFSFTGRD